MRSPFQELISWVVFIVVFAAFVWFLTRLIAGRRRRAMELAWIPLLAIVNGSFNGNPYHGKMSGIHSGRGVTAEWIMGGEEDPDRFSLTMVTAGHGTQWKIEYASERLFGQQRWLIRSKDERVKSSLWQSGILAKMESWRSHPSIEYSPRSKCLVFRDTGAIPDAMRFAAQLELLVRLAALVES